jgi:CheY-like chemotaxis protein
LPTFLTQHGRQAKQDQVMSERILIVDDESATRSALSMLLRREGFEVADASDGPTAPAKRIAFRSDPILLDIMMPGMN